MHFGILTIFEWKKINKFVLKGIIGSCHFFGSICPNFTLLHKGEVLTSYPGQTVRRQHGIPWDKKKCLYEDRGKYIILWLHWNKQNEWISIFVLMHPVSRVLYCCREIPFDRFEDITHLFKNNWLYRKNIALNLILLARDQIVNQEIS